VSLRTGLPSTVLCTVRDFNSRTGNHKKFKVGNNISVKQYTGRLTSDVILRSKSQKFKVKVQGHAVITLAAKCGQSLESTIHCTSFIHCI